MIQAVLLLAASKVAVAMVSAGAGQELLAPGAGSVIPPAVFLAALLVFSAAAVWLVLGGGSDRRSVYLGLAYLLVAVAFGDGLLGTALAGGEPGRLAGVFRFFKSLTIEAFLPFSLWLFAREFPRTAPFSRSVRLATAMAWIAGVVGAILTLANLLLGLGVGGESPLRLLAPSAYSAFWTIVFLLTLPVFPFIVWKARQADREERRRVRLFVAGLVLGMGPLFTEVVLEALIPPYARFMERPVPLLVGGLILYPLLFSIPFTTAYSVVVHKALAVKLIVRRALQYVLARYSVMVLAALPLVGLAVYVYNRQDEPIGALLTGGRGVLLVSASVLALIGVRARGPLLEAIDRRFFREQYDARQILADLVRRSRSAESPERLARLLEAEIDRALHLEAIAVLEMDPASGSFVASGGKARPLGSSSPLATIAAGGAEPLSVDLEEPTSTLARLPESDREWLADGGFTLLVPLLASDGSALGLIALGDKLSELPFSIEDRSLLSDIAASGSLALENLTMLSSAASSDAGADGSGVGLPGTAVDALAVECIECHLLYPPGTAACESCSGALIRTPIPFILLGKFRLERRLGAGGMGVVYKATDLVLGRSVAIKTLPRVSPERSLRMRREARAMAAVTHPNLALIFGAETWRGTPMLIFELLAGGTLSDRLGEGPRPIPETLDMGIELAGAVEALHRAGILHRDIKPSNIGFTLEGTDRSLVKLLDFGLARMLAEDLEELPGTAAASDAESGLEDETVSMVMRTGAGKLVGTPLYMSPEATAGAEPDPSFDLWGLSLVLYEALAGKNPLASGTLEATRVRILAADLPRLSELRPDCPAEVSGFFERALSRRASRRPTSARELRRWLRELRSDAAAA